VLGLTWASCTSSSPRRTPCGASPASLIGQGAARPRRGHPEEREAAIRKVAGTGRLFLYDHFGAAEWDVIKARIRYMVVACGCKVIVLDHLTALAAGEEDEKQALDKIMAELAGQAQELGHVLMFISHLATPRASRTRRAGA
jgi:twinkle protein